MEVPTSTLLVCVQRPISKPTKVVLTFPFLEVLHLLLKTPGLPAQWGCGLLSWSSVLFLLCSHQFQGVLGSY